MRIDLRKSIASYIDRLAIKHIGRWFSYSVIIGIVGGIGALVFTHLLNLSTSIFLNQIAGYYPPLPGIEASGSLVNIAPMRRWLLLIIPALGGLISGLLVYGLAPEAEGHGTDSVIDSFHRFRGMIRLRVPFVKIVASAVTIGTGGSAGREGPVAQIGAGFASYFARVLKLSDRDRRILLLAGMGAGIGSIFRAPLGGALFAAEVLYREPEFEFEAVMPTFISSIVGYSVYCSLLGGKWGSIFDTTQQAFTFRDPRLLILYAILGILMALVGVGYVKVFYGLRDKVFRRLRIRNCFKPALGGLLLGLIAFLFPPVLGMGYGWIQQAIEGNLTLRFLLVLGFAKILATSLTIGSGGSGGVFAPSIVIGGLLGGAFGQVCAILFPEMVIQPTAFVLVGMAGFFAGVAKVPIASLIMVSEMTIGYALLVPIMMVVAITYLAISSQITIYEKQVDARVDSPAHQGDFVVDVLEMMKVSDIINLKEKIPLIPATMHLDNILKLVTETKRSSFPVVGEDGKLLGIISLDDIRGVFLEEDLGTLVIAKDIAVTNIEVIYPHDDLNVALKKIIAANYDELPVVDATDEGKIIGMLARRDLMLAYSEQMKKRRGL